MKWFKIFLYLLTTVVLTILTQVGGIVFLFSIILSSRFEKIFAKISQRVFIRIGVFIILYTLTIFLIVPILAKPFGRVPLPMGRTKSLQAGRFITVLLGRNYVRQDLRRVAYEVSEEMNKEFPGTTVNYLDANFPFINKFPLLPHLSHNDGKKLDLAFVYNEARTGRMTDDVPSIIGYGICEAPRQGEENMPDYCERKGYWQYNLLSRTIPQIKKENFIFDPIRTRRLVRLFEEHDEIGRIFIEPHLRTRLELINPKIAFHGCHAVRHDDHFHIQLH
jgi:hypothetical protein